MPLTLKRWSSKAKVDEKTAIDTSDAVPIGLKSKRDPCQLLGCYLVLFIT